MTLRRRFGYLNVFVNVLNWNLSKLSLIRDKFIKKVQTESL